VWIEYMLNDSNMFKKYYDKYKPSKEQDKDYYKLKKKMIQIGVVLSVIAVITYLYKK